MELIPRQEQHGYSAAARLGRRHRAIARTRQLVIPYGLSATCREADASHDIDAEARGSCSPTRALGVGLTGEHRSDLSGIWLPPVAAGGRSGHPGKKSCPKGRTYGLECDG